MESTQLQTLNMIENLTKEILLKVIQSNQMDVACMTPDGVWFTGAAAHRLFVDEIPDYLRVHAIHEPVDVPVVTYTQTDQIADVYISVTGTIEYHSSLEDHVLITVSFNADWVLTGQDWKVRKLITTSRRDFEDENVWNSDARIDKHIICDSMPVGLVSCTNDAQLSIQLMNAHAYQLLGFSSISEYRRSVGESVLAAIHPDDLSVFRAFIRTIQQEGYAESEYFRMRRKDYSYLWTQFLGGLAEHKWLIFACIDHSEEKERVQKLEEKHSEAEKNKYLYQDMIDSMPGGFHKCSLFDPIHMVYISDSLCELCGYSQKEIFEDLQGYYSNLVVPEDHHVLGNAIRRLIEYPHTEHLEYRLKRKDGTTIWASEVSRSVRDQDGKMWAYAVVQDIDEEHSRRVLFGNMAEQMPLGFATYRYYQGVFSLLYCNNAYAQASGYTKAEYMSIAGRDPLSKIIREDLPAVNAQLEHVRLQDGVMQVEGELHVMGRTRKTKVHYYAAQEDDGNDGYLVRVFLQNIQQSDPEEDKQKKAGVAGKPRHEVDIHTFGYFEVFVDGKPINLHTKKGQEMLALLVDRQGGFVSQSMMISTLWEDETANTTTLARCRRVYKSLIDELKSYGIEDIVESDHGARRIVPEKVNCDLFNYRSGKSMYRSLFKGSYMTDYSWSEVTLGELLMEQNGSGYYS